MPEPRAYIGAIRFCCLATTLLLCSWSQAVISTEAGEPGRYYRRASRPHFTSKAIRDRQTQVVFEEMDLKNNHFVARVVRKHEVLHEMDFRFEPPPRELRAGQSFELAATVRTRQFHPDAATQHVAKVEFVLTPDTSFSVTGYPVQEHPTRFSAVELQSAASADSEQPATQQVAATLVVANEKRITCGYAVRLGWGDDLHEIRVAYSFRLKGKWWAASAGTADKSTAADAHDPAAISVPAAPWREEGLVRLFALYLAEVNEALREERGAEWAVDAWGREVGPDTVVPVHPGGEWENPNHYLWNTNPRYDFYPTGVRQYFPARLRAEAGDVESL